MTAATTYDGRALGTYVHLAVADPDVLAVAVARTGEVLDAVDRTCSRFRDDSDLARVNRAPGGWVAVDPLLAAAVSVALAAAEETDGLVDPCLGRQLVALGYDADIAEVRERREGRLLPLPPPAPDAWRDVEVDPEGAVRIPEGVALDLGATCKAWAADLVAATLVDELGSRVLVSLGGDLAVLAPDGSAPAPWSVRITEHPDGDGDDLPPCDVTLTAGGLATSSVAVRRWVAGDIRLHHVLDPRSGLPTQGPWRTVTTTGPTSVAANVAATAALVLGGSALTWLAERSVDARLVGTDGTVRHLGAWPAPVDGSAAGVASAG